MPRPRHYPSRRRQKPGGAEEPFTPSADPSLRRVFAQIGVPAPRPFTPDRFQLEALATVGRADCLVTAPTGSGKTWIAEQAIARVLEDGGRAWYACPLKALSNAKHAEFSARFGPERVGILTGDRKENPEAAVVVGTTEILRNQLYDAMHSGESLRADFVVLDEAHFLGDTERGVVWEEVMIYLPARIPLLLLSATIGNAAQIAGWLESIRGRPCAVVAETRRPVPLFPLFLRPGGTLLPLAEPAREGAGCRLSRKVAAFLGRSGRSSFRSPRLPPFARILEALREHGLLPAIFFLKSRADCDAALDLCRGGPALDPARRHRIRSLVEEAAAQAPRVLQHRQLRHLETLGVGAHHAGQLPSWKILLERLMTAGLMDAVFATTTVAAGVNFPARTIALLNSDRFNGTAFLPLDATEFHQMTGRAGRRGMDNIGFALTLPGRYMDVRHVCRLLGSPATDVRSQIRINFSMTLNLLLSHSPGQVQDLLRLSFATWLIREKRERRGRPEPDRVHLWDDFTRHLEFLRVKGYVDADGRLTPDGGWASRLRVDQPLLIGEGFRHNLFPVDQPELMAAVIAVFVNEREADEQVDRRFLPLGLLKSYQQLTRRIGPLQQEMADWGFDGRRLYLRPAAAVFAWANGGAWEEAVGIAEVEEGDFAMLVLRTADNLRHVRALAEFFPGQAASADRAIELILRDPVV